MINQLNIKPMQKRLNLSRPLRQFTRLKIHSPLLILAGLLVFNGCRSMPFMNKDKSDEDGARGVVSLHEIIPEDVPSGKLGLRLSSRDGERVMHVNKIPLLASVFFPKVEFEPGSAEDTKIMIVDLDRRGQMRWMQMSAELAGRYVAVLVDGRYQFMWRVPSPGKTQRQILRLHGPWGDEVAERISERAAKNYRTLNNK